MADVLIALGGNVGDVRATFQKAIGNICGMTQGALLARSSDYATLPWGELDQAHFINACIEIETSLDPHALLFTLHKIEKKFGRDRGNETRWGPRTLDLDLIAYDDVSIDKPERFPAAAPARRRARTAGDAAMSVPACRSTSRN
jgi:2-amino-4-hydroxy-6-hydroxymethyldihydropteridine diphosphokinase